MNKGLWTKDYEERTRRKAQWHYTNNILLLIVLTFILMIIMFILSVGVWHNTSTLWFPDQCCQ